MKLSDLSDHELIALFESYGGLGVGDYLAFTREFLKRLKLKINYKPKKQEHGSIEKESANGGSVISN
jgi:hypothetical protein